MKIKECKYVPNKNEVDFFNLIELTSFGGSWGLSLDDYYQKDSLKPITKTPKGGTQPPFFLPKKAQAIKSSTLDFPCALARTRGNIGEEQHNQGQKTALKTQK